MEQLLTIAIIAIPAIALVLFMGLLLKLYTKCGPNEALIITGQVPDGIQVYVSGGAIVWPLINQKHTLSLESTAIKFDAAESMRTKDGLIVYADGQALVKVTAEESAIKLAAERFISKPKDEIVKMAQPIISAHLCALAATMTVEQMRQHMDSFTVNVQETARADLAKMGLTVDSFIIKGIWETAGSPNASGTKKTAEASGGAAAGEAQFAH